MAKADEEDINEMRTFFRLLDFIFPKWSMSRSVLSELDPEDDDYEELNRFVIKQSDKWANGSPGDFDYERFLEHWHGRVGHRNMRVIFGYEVMIDNACDPTEDHLSFYPGFELFHVAPEQ